jgi:hypothetical protein
MLQTEVLTSVLLTIIKPPLHSLSPRVKQILPTGFWEIKRAPAGYDFRFRNSMDDWDPAVTNGGKTIQGYHFR